MKQSERDEIKTRRGGHGWECPDGSYYRCESESSLQHTRGSGLWGHERYALNLLEEEYPKLLIELEAHIEKRGYESFEDTDGDNVVRNFMRDRGFVEI